MHTRTACLSHSIIFTDMSYRLEQNPFTGKEELVLDGWERGISSSPYSIFSPSALGPINQTGMVDLSYGNIVGIPGEFSVNFPLAVSTIAGSPPKSGGQIIQFATEIDNNSGGAVTKYYALDSFGQVFSTDGTYTGTAITWTYQGHVGSNSVSIVGNSGIVFWQGYLLIFRGNAAYYSNDGGVTNNDWTGVVGALQGSGSTLYAISSKVSDRVYFCNGNGVGAIILTPGQSFNPASATTFTFYGGTNNNMVNIPAYDMATCLAEINGQILIGGALNRVYPWDAANLAGTGVTSLVGLPLFIGDRYVQRIVVVNTNAYIFAGHPVIPTGRGYIYIYNGSTIDVFMKMPDNFTTIAGASSTSSTPYWQFGDAMWHRNQIIFGAVAIGNISGSAISDTGGVWAIDIASQALYRTAFAATNSDLITGLTPNDTGTTIQGQGFLTGSSIGAFYNNSSTMSASRTARAISDKIPVGTKFFPKTYEQLEVKTAVALAANESIAITVFSDQDPSGISIGTMTSSDGLSRVFSPLTLFSGTGPQGLQWLQVQAVLTPTNTNPTFVRLREIRLR